MSLCSLHLSSNLRVYLAGYGTFMEKEIFEQPESVINTMRGRVDFDNYKGNNLVVWTQSQ